MADPFPQIKHVILLALENRSFDHMLGGLPGVDGASAQWSNSDGQNDYAQTPLPNWRDPAARIVNPDPKHETPDVLTQLQNANRGVVANYVANNPATTREQRQKIMSFYPDGSLAPLHTLAKTFAVCDRWHASVPGPTWTNRLFMLSGTSSGRVVMPSPLDYDQPSVFRRLFEAGRSSRVYYGDVPLALQLSDQRVADTSSGYDPTHSYYPLFLFKYLAHDKKEANFPDFVFIEPAYTMGPNDDHPPHDPIRGERLIAEVYNELRANDRLWRTSLLVILYDEHGGFADHVPPSAAVPPDAYNVDGFAFDRLGVRVPAVFVSPWLTPQVCNDLFDHTSLLKSLTEKWGLGPLGARTAAAADVFAALQKSPSVRSDTPASLSAEVTPPAVSPDVKTDHERAAEELAAKLDPTPGLTPRERVERYLRPEATSIEAP
jgi:phospholipase C